MSKGPVGRQLLLLVMLIDAFSFALVLPVLPFLVLSYQHGAEVGGLLVAAHQLAAFAAAPLLGLWSDRIGRRAVIFATVLGTVVAYLMFAFSSTLVTLVISRVLAGVMAGNISVLQAAAVDGNAPEERPRILGQLTTAWALGYIIGPATSAALAVQTEHIGLLPGLVAAVASGFALLVLWLESPRANPQTTLKVASAGAGTSPWPKSALLTIIVVIAFSQAGLVSMTGFWGNSAHGWTAREVGLLFFWVAAWIVLTQAVLLPRLAAKWGEARAILLCCAACAAAALAVVLRPESLVVLLGAIPVMFGGLVMGQTLCFSLLSSGTSNLRQGTVLGVANSVGAVGRVIGPPLCGSMFARITPSAPFWLVTAMFVGLFLWLARRGLAQRPLVIAASAPERGS